MGHSGAVGQGMRYRTRAAAVLAVLFVVGLVPAAAKAAPPTVSAVSVSRATTSSVSLKGEVNPEGNKTQYSLEYGTSKCPAGTCTTLKRPEVLEGTTPLPVSFELTGLSAGTLYHFRLVAKSSGGSKAAEGVFATYANPLEGLPDERTYEQASPVDKNGGNAEGLRALVKATPEGGGITFLSTFGFPGEVGAQTRSTYLGKRGTEAWSPRGMLPPESTGEGARVLGWLPDLSVDYSSATKFTNPPVEALIAEPTDGGPPRTMTAYVPEAKLAYAGATPGGAVVFFEAEAKLPPKPGGQAIAEALEGVPNLYAWDRESGEVSLVGVLNDESPPALGAFAGPYDWALGSSPFNLTLGGGARNYYLQDGHALRPDGSIYFTAAGTGQLYLRENPTKPQSAVNGAGECLDPAKACTVHVSASVRTPPDSAGPQPAAFQAATQDGTKAYFTSPEMLTDDANTGPEQPPASIVSAEPNGGNIDTNFIPQHALGLAVDSSHIYWADPVNGTIGRANLDGSEVKGAFIAPGPTRCGKEVEPGVFEGEEASKPRYVAVEGEYIYWTNAGCPEVAGLPETEGGGSIGRAKINPVTEEAEEVEPEFIPGTVEPSPGEVIHQVSNPQGIAVNAAHIYWANAPYDPVNHAIAQATTGGGEVKPRLVETGSHTPFGVALDASHVYFAGYEELNNNGFVSRVPLGGGAEETVYLGEVAPRGVAVDAAHVYWASQGKEAIGRVAIGSFIPGVGECETVVIECERKFIDLSGAPNGVAVDAAHLFWSINGETPPNPGNDLYRFEPESGSLTDLTPDSSGDGAEVLGVLGASADGSYLYFAANGDLGGPDGPTVPGTCHSSVPRGPLIRLSGHCYLYLYREGANHEGTTSFVAPLDTGGSEDSDALDWTPTPTGTGGAGNYLPRTALLGEGGKTLLFRSQEQLTPYENHGVPQFYLYHAGDGTIRCVSCNPSGEAPGEGPGLGRVRFPSGVSPPEEVWAVLSRNLSADGNHFFFETRESLTPADTNGGAACEVPLDDAHPYPPCEDVYEWEAPGTGSCTKGGPSYSPLDEGCLFLVSGGKEESASLFGDASESGEDVFFFTHQQLVGQDKDELQDVYDARVHGGLASQNPSIPAPCEGVDACHGPEQGAASAESPASSKFQGPPNPKPKRKKKAKVKAKHRHHHQAKHHHRGSSNGRGGNR